MSTAKPVRKRRKEARPGELLAAALALFVEKGYAATRLDDVAARAGVSKGTLYLYYASKEALFKAVIQEGIVPVLAENEAIAASHEGSSFSLLEKLLDHWWTRIGCTAFAGIPKLIVAEAQNFPEIASYYTTNVIARGRALVGAALSRGVSSGEFRPCDVEQTIDVIIAPLLMLLIWEHSLVHCGQPALQPRAYLATHLALLQRGLCAARV
ncbi:TetR/AcrR family transcriptional regulator [Azonexus sp.]|uniref:TetR/AcrR family transcriptional regulator n=1 Tax=Azonexus sp. TaxID=1872668 RepID=UPI0035AE8A58